MIAIVIIFFQVKKRRARRVRFQQLANTTRATPTSRSVTTQQFCPKPDEWYRTIEGHWVQGPPPVYAFDASQENAIPQSDGESFQLELVNEQNIGSGQSTNMTTQLARMASLDQTVSPSPLTVRHLQSPGFHTGGGGNWDFPPPPEICNKFIIIEKSVNDDQYPLTFPRFVDASIDSPQAKILYETLITLVKFCVRPISNFGNRMVLHY